MKKTAPVSTIAVVLEGFRSTKERKTNITRLYTFIKEIKNNEEQNRSNSK